MKRLEDLQNARKELERRRGRNRCHRGCLRQYRETGRIQAGRNAQLLLVVNLIRKKGVEIIMNAMEIKML